MLKIAYNIGHFLYENPYTKKFVPRIVNYLKPDSVILDNNRIFIDKEDRVISLELLISGKWEEFERKLFKEAIQPGDTVIDIGAHIGTFTLVAAQKVGPSGRVFAFEPLAKNFSLLKKNVEANGFKNVTLVNKAVSDINGSAKLFLSNEDNFGDQRIFDSQDNRQAISIETITLDSYFQKKKVQVNVMKMDIQGAEVRALKGASKLLSQSPKLKLFTEFWPKALRAAGSSGSEYLHLLKKHQFEFYEIDSRKENTKKVSEKVLLSNYSTDSIFNADLYCQKRFFESD